MSTRLPEQWKPLSFYDAPADAGLDQSTFQQLVKLVESETGSASSSDFSLSTLQIFSAVENALKMYAVFRHNEATQPKPKSSKGELGYLMEALQSAIGSLDALQLPAKELLEESAKEVSKSRSRGTNQTPFDTSPLPAQLLGRQRVRQLRSALQLGLEWTEKATQAVPPSTSGPKRNHSLDWLVGALADTWNMATGERLSRSYKKVYGKQLVETVVKKAEPTASDRQIEEAVRKAVRKRLSDSE
ncbi:hypothetical protein [Marinovum algicola]|uniref:hypothetical protein n=1 Tax=Marinovum algicola TaxID=42444 RepID=UPI0032ECEAA9